MRWPWTPKPTNDDLASLVRRTNQLLTEPPESRNAGKSRFDAIEAQQRMLFQLIQSHINKPINILNTLNRIERKVDRKMDELLKGIADCQASLTTLTQDAANNPPIDPAKLLQAKSELAALKTGIDALDAKFKPAA